VRLLDTEFYRLPEHSKEAFREYATEKADFEMVSTLGLEERGRYRLRQKRDLASGELEVVYEYHAGGFAIFCVRDGRIVDVSFSEGIQAWCEKDGRGPTDEMMRELRQRIEGGMREEEFKAAMGEYFRTLYAEEESGLVRYYALFPRCMLKVEVDEEGSLQRYALLTQDEAKKLFVE